MEEKQAAVISVADSMNYLLTEEALFETMQAARNSLEDGGIFIFDLKTEYFFKTKLDGFTFSDDLGDFSYVWKNYYDNEKHIHEYALRFRIKEKEGYRYERELHKQRTFTADEIKRAAKRAGYKKAAAFDAFTFNKPRKNSERIYLVCML